MTKTTRRASPAEKLSRARLERAFSRSCNHIVIPMLKIPAIYEVGRKAIEDGADDEAVERAMRAYVDTIKVSAR